MKKDIQIKVNTETNQVLINSEILGISSENLQGNIIFKPEPFINGTCRLYVEGLGVIEMDKQEDCYTLPIKSSLLKSPGIDICFKITEPTNEEGTPIFATKIIHLKVLDTIEDDSEIPEQYPTWIETFDSKIAEIDDKLEEADSAISNIQDLTAEYDQNAADKTNAFNQNAVNKTDDFNTNATNQTSTFDNHVTSKTEEFDADTDDIVGTKKAELDDYEETKENELDTYTNSLKNDLDTYESAKETELNSYTTTKKTELDTHTNNKKTELNTYEQSKETELDTYANGLKDTFNANAITKTSEFDQNASDKTDDFDDNASAKTTAFNDNATAKIAEYDAHVAELQSQVDDLTTLVETELESNEVEGTELDVSDSAEYPGKIIPGANLEQKQLSGKNLWGRFSFTRTMSGVTHQQNADGSIIVNGSTTNAKSYSMMSQDAVTNERIITLPAGDYTLSGASANVKLQFVKRDGTALFSINSSYSFTLTEETQGFVRTYVMENTVVNNETLYIQLEQGSTATDWEPYCGGQAAPNPSYEIPIKVVTGDNVVKHVGKNFCGLKDQTITKAGVTFIIKDGVITANGTYTANTLTQFENEDNLVLNGNYTVKTFPVSGSASTPPNFNVKNSDGTTLANSVATSGSSFTFLVEKSSLICGIYAQKGTTFDNFKLKAQIEKGTIPTPYEPYREEEEYKLDLWKENEFDSENANVLNAYFSEDGKMITSSNKSKTLYIPCKANCTYKITKKLSARFRLLTTNVLPDISVIGDNYIFGDLVNCLKITTGSNAKYLCVFFYNSDYDTLTVQEILDSIQIQESIELCKIGDYEDELFKNVVGDENYSAELEEGAWYKKKVIDKKVLDDLWEWFMPTTNRFHVNITLPDGEYDLVALCDKFINALYWTTHINTDKSFIVHNGNWGNNMCRISFVDKNCASLAEWTQFVSENNLIVYHRLLNPTFEKITDTTLKSQLEDLRKAKWFKGVNHFWTETENLEPVLKGTYKQSNNLRLQALEQAIVALGGV